MTIANLLLVDDETAFLDAMARRLKKRDFEVFNIKSRSNTNHWSNKERVK